MSTSPLVMHLRAQRMKTPLMLSQVMCKWGAVVVRCGMRRLPTLANALSRMRTGKASSLPVLLCHRLPVLLLQRDGPARTHLPSNWHRATAIPSSSLWRIGRPELKLYSRRRRVFGWRRACLRWHRWYLVAQQRRVQGRRRRRSASVHLRSLRCFRCKHPHRLRAAPVSVRCHLQRRPRYKRLSRLCAAPVSVPLHRCRHIRSSTTERAAAK